MSDKVLAGDAAIRTKIAPTKVRYIKLGTGNAWFDDCRANNRLELGHRAIPHDLAMTRDKNAVAAVYLSDERTASKATNYAREVLDFYDGDENALWITFAEGCLWWAFAKAEVVALGETQERGQRARAVIGSWSNRDVNGNLLTFGSLSTSLTQVAAYRQTICSVKAADYAVRRINGDIDARVVRAQQARLELLKAAEALIDGLHWRDFEILCDLIFSRSGWQRISELGGLQKDTDLVLMQPSTAERAFVQVKSRSDVAEYDGYADRFQADPGFERMFFVCHSFQGHPDERLTGKPIHFWAGPRIAEQAVAAGLFDWLVEKTV